MQQNATAASRNHQDGNTVPANVYESGQIQSNLLSNAAGTLGINQNNVNKRSIITQETDLQVSTFQASQMEQRAIFDTSPKLREGAIASSEVFSNQNLPEPPTTSEKKEQLG